MSIISRLAPTPSGYLHIGNALNFVLTWVLTRQAEGQLILRIDDLDEARAREAYLADVFRTLEWLGITWDKGPFSVDEHLQSYRQSQRSSRYLSAVESLMATGTTFACICSRKQIMAAHPQRLYTGTCYEKGWDYQKGATTLRVKTRHSNAIQWKDQWIGEMTLDLHQHMRDFVIRRKDGIPAYQVASLIDDRDLGVNLIVRGNDLIESTAAQLFLAQRLDIDSFLQTSFYHHPLITDADGNKLSKSNGALSLAHWRKHRSQQALYAFFSRLMGWTEEADSLDTFAQLWRKKSHLPSSFSTPFSSDIN
ncbi:MAG: glutamate--tRNA ligase family protein [Bacteroidota bacterium]